MTDFFPGFELEDERGSYIVDTPGTDGLTSRATIISNEGPPVFAPDGENFVRLVVEDETPTGASGGNCSISNRTTPRAFDAFAFRVRQFTQGLPAGRRREIDARTRFYRIPWVRLASDPDDDFLP